MTRLKLLLRPEIPRLPKAFGWVLVLAGLIFAYIYMMAPGLFFPGVVIETYSEQFGLYSTGVRILGAVLGILLALALNSAALLALMLVTRIFIELGDVCVGLVINNGSPDQNTFVLIALATVEMVVLATIVRLLLRSTPRP